tara:strand:- start:26488 stop:32583 length:6096 start_codon:yes stop_codon:yes gene_type:complete
MARRSLTFENVKFFTKRMLRKYKTSRGVLLDQNQKKLTVTHVNDDETSFRRKNENHGLVSTQQLPVDNSLFQNNTFFGSAEAKINIAFDKIINKYPFDGTLQQIEQFEDSLSSLEKYVLDKFPKHKGFLTFDSSKSQYITVKDKSGNLNQSLLNGEQGLAYINPKLNPFSIECALRLPTESNENSFICHSVHKTLNTGFAIFINQTSSEKTGTINFAIVSGSDNYATASYPLKKGKWYNLSFFYDNRAEKQTVSIMSGSNTLAKSDFFDYPGLNTSNADLIIGDGKNLSAGHLTFNKSNSFSGSIDEFRIFHGARSTDEVEYYSRRNIFAHDNLRLYFRFNEPAGSHSNNDVILDHSGNSLHSRISNYTDAIRAPREVIDPMFLEDRRFSPVLFPNYPAVINFNAKLLELATEYDINNPNLITKLIPNHYLQEGAYSEGVSVDGNIVEAYSSMGTLPKAGRIGHVQLMSLMLYYLAEELDQYKMYLDQASQFLHPDYMGEDGIADAFLPDLAKYYGFELPKIFGDVSFEQFLGKENLGLEYSVYERNLNEVQNLVWRRVLKNISHIFKSKGTKYALKTIFRSAGIEPDRLFRLVEYNGVDEFRMGISRQQITEMSTILNFSGSISKFVETSRPDGTIINRPTLLTAPLTASRIEPGFPEISGGNVLASASIHFHPFDETAIPAVDTKLTIQDAFNNTETFQFKDTSSHLAATATLTYSQNPPDTQAITLISSDGTSRTYEIDIGNGVTAGSVPVVRGDNGDATYANLKSAIESKSGHNEKITIQHNNGGDSNDAGSLVLTQAVAGYAGNTSITHNLAGVSGLTTFSGGTKVISRVNYKATLTAASAIAAHGTTEKQSITLISTDGTSKKYVIVHGGSDGKSAVPTGTVLASDSDTGSGTAGGGNVGGIAVNILSGDNQRDVLDELRVAVNHGNGHNAGTPNSKIIFPVVPDAIAGQLVVTLMQAVVSSDSAKTITEDISNITKTNFTLDTKRSALITTDLNTIIASSFPDTLVTKTKNKSAGNNIDTIELTTKSFSRSNIGNHLLSIASPKIPKVWLRMSSTAPTNLGTTTVASEYQPRAAHATLQVATGNAAHGTTELQAITLISTDQTTKTYTLVNGGGSGSSAVATGTVLAVGSDIGSRVIAADTSANSLVGGRSYRIKTVGSTSNWSSLGASSNTPAIGEVFTAANGVSATGSSHGTVEESIIGQIAVNILTDDNQREVLAELKTAINHSNGHNDGSADSKIIIPAVPSAAGSAQSIILEQATVGSTGSTSSTENIANLTITNFGGNPIAISSETIGEITRQAATFDGYNDSISIGSAAVWDAIIGDDTAGGSTKKMSFSIWIYKTADGEGDLGRIFDFGNSDIFLYSTSTEILAFSVRLNGSLTEWRTDASYFNLNEWTHIVITYDATDTANNNPVIYVNGQSRTVAHVGSSAAKHASFSGIATEACFIGNRNAEDRAFQGKISEFQVFNDILTANEISKIYAAESDECMPPFIAAKGFAGGNGFVRANTPGFEYAGISATQNDGLLTSGSWTVEGVYQFSSNLSKESIRSLSRIVTQGKTTGQDWKDKHGVLTNLVLSPFGDQLSLYVRSKHKNDAPVLMTVLTGANCLDGQKWYIAYGRQRNDEISQPVSSSYFIRAASYNFDKMTTFITTSSLFDEGSANDNVFQNTKQLVSTSTYEYFNPTQILIGSQSMANTSNGKFLNNSDTSVVPFDARTTYFDGRVGHLKFWSKCLTEEESKEHARNFKSVGTDNPLVNNTFSNTRSGSFQKLRLNVSTDQVNKKTNIDGSLNLLDFSQTFTPKNEAKVQSGVYTSMSGALCFGFESFKDVVENTRFDYTIISPFYDEYLESDKIKIAGFSEGPNIKLYNSKIAPVTEILPFEKKVNDNRFEIQVHLQRGLDEDIMNIFSAIDALDDALGKPELVFAQEYPDLRRMRDLYFNRLTDKVNYRNFFDLFRWLDDAFSDMVEKFVPRNSNFLGINLIIESHALERYKIAYGHQEIYKGEDERAKLRSKILVSQRSGVLRRF